ncbi:MAG: rhodanese-like domain-containing protein [Coriobacteriales bacterium]|nr:rhodanese-like domain-containing protein [Coriobacteriales bacterium]
MNQRIVIWTIVGAVVAGLAFVLMTPATATKQNIESSELTQLQNGGAWVIDVRTNSEYVRGHIPDSLNLPLEQLKQTAATWSKTQPIVVYCATGARSAEAASYLTSQGFKKVYDLSGGMAGWTGPVAGGQPATSVPKGPGVVETGGEPVFIDFAGST